MLGKILNRSLKICGGRISPTIFFSRRHRVAAFTHQGYREENQDGLLFFPQKQRVTLAVADGLGGAPAGEIASQIALETIEASLNENYSLADAFDWANSKIRGLSLMNPYCRGMGTTIVAAEIKEKSAKIYNCGDSRAFLIDARSRISLLTPDDSTAFVCFQRKNFPVSFPHFEPEEYYEYSRAFKGVDFLTNYLGNLEAPIHTLDLPLIEGDRILLCSDGLYKAISYQDFAGTLRQRKSLPQIVKELFERAYRTMQENEAGDNLTIMLHEHQS